MNRRATQTREIDFLREFFRRITEAKNSGDYEPVKELCAPDVVLRYRRDQLKGPDSVVDHFKELAARRHQIAIAAPKGGLVTVLVRDVSWDGTLSSQSSEQIFRIAHDKLVELIDLGRSASMVHRPESQPS